MRAVLVCREISLSPNRAPAGFLEKREHVDGNGKTVIVFVPEHCEEPLLRRDLQAIQAGVRGFSARYRR